MESVQYLLIVETTDVSSQTNAEGNSPKRTVIPEAFDIIVP